MKSPAPFVYIVISFLFTVIHAYVNLYRIEVVGGKRSFIVNLKIRVTANRVY